MASKKSYINKYLKGVLMMKKIIISALLILLFLLGSCTHLASVKKGNFITDNNRFALKFYAAIESQKENTFISPYSISTALAMTYAGAEGKTKKEMAEVLEFNQSEDELLANFDILEANLGKICKEQDVDLFTANALWIHKNYEILKSYRETMEKYFSSSLYKVDFVDSTAKAAARINNWVAAQTRDKIQDLIHRNDIDAFTRLVLTNAIYFKGDWKYQFAERSTKKMDFWLQKDISTEVDMMYQRHKLPYAESKRFQILELPYKDSGISMLIFLPRKQEDIKMLEKYIAEDSLLYKQRKMENVEVYLPKFKIEKRYAKLKKTFRKLGMERAFSAAEANFSGISPADDLFIGKIIHQAYIDVNEQGTEAAAATAVSMRLKSVAPPPNPVVFKADHPFFFVIQENTSDTILFLGRVNQP